MSFITRIAARTAPAPQSVAPKGFVRRSETPAQQEDQAQPLRRQEVEEEEMQTVRRVAPDEQQDAQALRRQEQDSDEEALQTLRRQPEEEEEPAQALRRQQEEEEELQTLRRASPEEEEQAQPVRRQEEEEEMQALHRVTQDEEEPVQALRREEEEQTAQPLCRQEDAEEEEVQALRRQEQEEEEAAQPLRREADSPANLNPENSPFPEEMRDEAELPTVSALRREVSAPPGNAGALPTLPIDPGMSLGEGLLPPSSADDTFTRPSVQIDQLDVLIQEPSTSAATASTTDRSRAIRARYLRRI